MHRMASYNKEYSVPNLRHNDERQALLQRLGFHTERAGTHTHTQPACASGWYISANHSPHKWLWKRALNCVLKSDAFQPNSEGVV